MFALPTGFGLTMQCRGGAGKRFDPADPRLRWAPPELVSPIEVNVPTGFSQTIATPGADYLFKPPVQAGPPVTYPTRTAVFICDGARRAHYVGGKLAYNPVNGAIAEQFIRIDEAVYREGAWLVIQRLNTDAIAAGGNPSSPYTKFPDIIIQRCFIESAAWDGVAGTHPDAYQSAQSSIGRLMMDTITIVRKYQALFLDPARPMGDVWLSRINMRPAGGAAGKALWLFTDAAAYNGSSHKIYLDEVYIEPRSGLTLDDEVWPNSSVATIGGEMGTDDVGDFYWWPAMPRIVDRFGHPGKVRLGPPPDGDFAPSGQVGLGYVGATEFQNI